MTNLKENAITSSGMKKKDISFIDKVLEEKDFIIQTLEKTFKNKVNKSSLEGLNTNKIALYIGFEDLVLDDKGDNISYEELDKKFYKVLLENQKRIKHIKFCRFFRPTNISMSWTSGNNKFSVARDYYGFE